MSGLGVKANRMPVVVRPFRMCSINMDVFPLHILGRIFATPFQCLVFGATSARRPTSGTASLLHDAQSRRTWAARAARDEEEYILRTDQGKQQ